MERVAVGDVMTRKLITVDPSSSLYDCAKLLVKERVNTLLVSKNKRLLGILTSRDILWTLIKKPGIDLRKHRAITIATKKVAVIKPSADIHMALDKMRSLNFRRLPVISRGELIGMITLRDILSVDPNLYAEISPFFEVREEKTKLNNMQGIRSIDGLCEHCGALSDVLRVNGRLLCLDCRDELF